MCLILTESSKLALKSYYWYLFKKAKNYSKLRTNLLHTHSAIYYYRQAHHNTHTDTNKTLFIFLQTTSWLLPLGKKSSLLKPFSSPLQIQIFDTTFFINYTSHPSLIAMISTSSSSSSLYTLWFGPYRLITIIYITVIILKMPKPWPTFLYLCISICMSISF